MKKEYKRPSMMVTCYSAMDKTNLTLNVSYAITAGTGAANMSEQSFTLHK